MSVSIDDVRHIAELARLGLDDARAAALVRELNDILGHMAVLAKVDTSRLAAAEGVGVGGTPLRPDGGEPDALHRPRESLAPAMRDGFFLVPRLASHEAAGEAAE
ncbi:MAG TPA: Asp-tRNA(Asn)/Glu-tRNA(Gln) amidotransferase subunit GatC [Gemmatimonadaceae bacterium]|nr:Asp-tRNA(Asn)/Glu-tRNA(Gln) amidotransferase subunit GatC [Gemmatimonadaceae bacterium]